MSRPRVLLAGLYHESHSFLDETTPLEDFTWQDGEALLGAAGDVSATAGAVETAAELGWELLPGVYAAATPGAVADDEVLEGWWRRFEPLLRAALRDGLDGLFLVLHGAMATVGCADVEGELLRRLRAITGPALPVGGVTDLHANVSGRMIEHSHLLVTYRENPHTDIKLTAVRAAQAFDPLVRGRASSHLFRQAPMVWPPTGTGTASDPMRALEAAARALEAELPGVLAVNVHAGFAFGDSRDTGVSFSATTVGDPEPLAADLEALAERAWSLRHAGLPAELTLGEALERVQGLLTAGRGGGPIVLAEPADNIGGGAPGDATALLRGLLAAGVPGLGACLWDPVTVAALAEVPLGGRRRVALGGRGSRLGGPPLELDVELVSRSDGRFELEDPNSHLAASGRWFAMGPCAVVRPAGSDARILLTSRRTPPFDLAQWRSQGIAPERLEVVVVKAAVAHGRAYDPIARARLWVGTPGACPSDPGTLPYRRLRRPIFPLDPLEEPPGPGA